MGLWMKRRPQLSHDYSVAAWSLSPVPEIQEQVRTLWDASHKTQVDKLIKKLLVPQNLSVAEEEETSNRIHDEFWSEWHDFRSRGGLVFNASSRIWKSEMITTNQTHMWHQVNTLYQTKWLGKLACRVTSKINGIGSAERNWGQVKRLKSGQRSHLSSSTVSKQATIYGAACAERARKKPPPGTALKIFDEDDLENLGLSKFGIDEKSIQALVSVRFFRCFEEPWEPDALANKQPENEEKLKRKYGGLEFKDGDTHYTISSEVMHFQRERGNKSVCGVLSTRRL